MTKDITWRLCKVTLCTFAIISATPVLAQQLACSPIPGAASISAVQAAAWRQAMLRLLNESGFPNLPEMRIAAQGSIAAWNDPRLGNFYEWEVIGNTVPKSDPNYYIPSLKRFTDGYFTFLTNIDPKLSNSAASKKAEAARKAYLNAKSQLDAHRDRSPAAVAASERNLREASTAYAKYLNQAYQGTSNAGQFILDFENPAYQKTAVSPDGLSLNYRTFNFSPDLSQWLAEAANIDQKKIVAMALNPGADIISFPGNVAEASDTIILASKQVSISRAKPTPAPAAQGPEPKITVSPSSSNDIVNSIVVGAKAVGDMALGSLADNIEIHAKRIGYFSISPGRWFNSTALQLFKTGPWVDGPVKKNVIALWGDNGILNSIPTGVVVAYGISAVIKSKPSCFDALKKYFSGAEKIQVGPISFSGSQSTCDLSPTSPGCKVPATQQASVPSPVVTDDNGKKTVTIGNPSSAQIIGITVAVMPDL
jgi:hypothetical protein